MIIFPLDIPFGHPRILHKERSETCRTKGTRNEVASSSFACSTFRRFLWQDVLVHRDVLREDRSPCLIVRMSAPRKDRGGSHPGSAPSASTFVSAQTSASDDVQNADDDVVVVNALRCDRCDGTFPSTRSLGDHVRKRHVNEQKCPHCASSYSLNYMKQHIAEFHESSIHCRACDKTLKHLNSARHHASSHGHVARVSHWQHSGRRL